VQRAAARRAAARREAQRRQRIRIGAAVLVVAVIGAVIYAFAGSDKKDTASTTDTSGPVTSAAGKPCLAVKDKPPAGAPAVPVEKGKPPTKLVSKDLKAGDGATVGKGDTVTINYIGVACSTGKIFDSSYARKQPATFGLSGLIKGWQEGIPGMKVGGRRLLGIPPDLGYGKPGRPPTIRPSETLWFVVEVLDTKPATTAST
jgi:peptidylprolyl isomerase